MVTELFSSFIGIYYRKQRSVVCKRFDINRLKIFIYMDQNEQFQELKLAKLQCKCDPILDIGRLEKRVAFHSLGT